MTIANSPGHLKLDSAGVPEGYKLENALSVLEHSERHINGALEGFHLFEPPDSRAHLVQRELFVALWYIFTISNSKPSQLRALKLLSHPHMRFLGTVIFQSACRFLLFADAELRDAARRVVGCHATTANALFQKLIVELRPQKSTVFHYGVEALTLLFADEEWGSRHGAIITRLRSCMCSKEFSIGPKHTASKELPSPEAILLWVLSDHRVTGTLARFRPALTKLWNMLPEDQIAARLLTASCLKRAGRTLDFSPTEILPKLFNRWGSRWSRLAIIEALPVLEAREFIPCLVSGLTLKDTQVQLGCVAALVRFGVNVDEMSELMVGALKNPEQCISGFARRLCLSMTSEFKERIRRNEDDPRAEDYRAAIRLFETSVS